MKYRFVAMLDILGFKALVEQLGIEKIHQIMLELFKSAQRATNIDFGMEINRRLFRHPAVRLNYFIFSDTILLWKDYQEIKHDKEGKEIFEGKCSLFREFNRGISRILELALLKNIPLRGGIAFGKTIINIDKNKNNNEIIGQPIINAYLVGEALNWIGVAFHSSCQAFIHKECDKTVIKYNIPYHEDRLKKITHGIAMNYSLEWGGGIKENINEIFNELKRKNISEKILKKYNETAKFCWDHNLYF